MRRGRIDALAENVRLPRKLQQRRCREGSPSRSSVNGCRFVRGCDLLVPRRPHLIGAWIRRRGIRQGACSERPVRLPEHCPELGTTRSRGASIAPRQVARVWTSCARAAIAGPASSLPKREVGTAREPKKRHKDSLRDLLKLARLRRRRAELHETFAQGSYEIAEASLHWLAYQLLGKLRPVIYVLARQ